MMHGQKKKSYSIVCFILQNLQHFWVCIKILKN